MARAMILAASTGSALWYLARGTGLVSIVLLTIVMVLGITEVQRWAREGWPRLVIAGLHKNVSLLVVCFLGVHIASSVLDSFVPISWVAAFVPFTSPYRPLWLGLGAVSFDLLLALVITSLLRGRIGHRAWRTIHWAAYASWPIAFVHGLGTGSDGRVGWVVALDLACLGAVLAAIVWRLAVGWERAPGRRAAGALASAIAVVGVLGWVATGPSQPGWAAKAGTPTSASSAAASASDPGTGAADSGSDPASADPTTPAAALKPPFTADFSGTVAQADGGSTATVTIDGTLTGAASGSLQVVLKGNAIDGGGVQMTSSTVTLSGTSPPTTYTGSVRSLKGGTIVAVVRSGSGTTITLTMDLRVDDAAGTASGTVTAAAA
ncbi:MAG: ferric reductase-like transmembrane domain-containing protein [Acidimicrobiales bacterium]